MNREDDAPDRGSQYQQHDARIGIECDHSCRMMAHEDGKHMPFRNNSRLI